MNFLQQSHYHHAYHLMDELLALKPGFKIYICRSVLFHHRSTTKQNEFLRELQKKQDFIEKNG